MDIRNGFIRGTYYGQKITNFNPYQTGSIIKHLGEGAGEYTSIANPSSGTNYTYSPSWNDWLNVYAQDNHVGGKTEITIIRKPTGTSWDLPFWLKVNYSNFPS